MKTIYNILLIAVVIISYFAIGRPVQANDYHDWRMIQFRDGSSVTGEILEITPERIRIKLADGRIMTRKFDDVESVAPEPEPSAVPEKKPFRIQDLFFWKKYKKV